MGSNSLLIICTHGTYGRDDDLYGALLASNASLAKGMKVTLLLIDEGVFACKKNQNPMKLGLPSSLDELNDFLELGGNLLVEDSSLVERGIEKKEMIDGAKIIKIKKIDEIIKKHDVSLTF
jgi:sulfur relay (sulfurtransferase) DsrF/TusC family protein